MHLLIHLLSTLQLEFHLAYVVTHRSRCAGEVDERVGQLRGLGAGRGQSQGVGQDCGNAR